MAGYYVKENISDCKKVWIMGMNNLKDEIEALGIECLGGTNGLPQYDFPNDPISVSELDSYKLDPEIGAVI